MTPYYVLIATPILCAGAMKIIKRENKKIPMQVFFILLIFLLAVRNLKIGTDTLAYEFFFSLVNNFSWDKLYKMDLEYGFVVLMKVIALFTQDPQWLIAIVAIVSTIPIAVLYSKENQGTALTISLYLITSNFYIMFSALRQVIALSIVAISFFAIKHKKPIVFVALVALAFLFHKSALIALILYPLYHAKISKLQALFIFPIAGIVFVFNESIFTFLIKVLRDDYEEMYGTITKTGAYTMLILFVLFTMFSFLVVKEGDLDDETRGLRNILLLTLTLQMFAPLNTVAMRMNYYSLMFMPLLIPRIINRGAFFDKRVYKLLYWGMTAFFIVYFFAKAYGGDNTLKIFPYVSMWE